MKFLIEQLDMGGERLPLSYKIREHIGDLVVKEILIPNNVIIGSKWQYRLVAIFDPDDGGDWEEKTAGTRLAAKSGVALIPPRTSSIDHMKWFTMAISYPIVANSPEPSLTYADLLYDGICLLFTTYFKKVKPAHLETVRAKIDRGYISSLPYPAPFAEQRYKGDTSNGRRGMIT